MSDSFGVRLRHRREEQGVALRTIAEQTKIKLSLLEALERDDVSHWPGGIFRRAYIRAYAHAIGLNPDVVVREFLEVHAEPQELVEPLAALASAADAVRTPPTRLGTMLRSAVGSLSRLRGAPADEEPPAAGEDAATAASFSDPARPTPSSEPDFLAVAQLCTELGRVESALDLQRLLGDAARILGAVGLIVWVWDPAASQLTPALVHGYSERVLAQLPPVRSDSDNATAAAFRTSQTCVINSRDQASGALVVPLLTPAACAGVLAIELQHGAERTPSVRAAATIFAALLAQLVGSSGAADVSHVGEKRSAS